MDGVHYEALIGVGGIGTGVFFALEGDHDIGRTETRLGQLMDYRDACKLHIIAHMARVLSGPRPFRVIPVGFVGRDPVGRDLLNQMRKSGLETRWVRRTDQAPTLFAVCFQFPDGSGGNLTPTNSACALLKPDDLERIDPLLARYGSKAMVLAAPEVALDVRARLLSLGSRYGCYRVASFVRGEIPAAARLDLFSQTDLLALNEEEAAAWVSFDRRPLWDTPFRLALERRVTQMPPSFRLIVTLGAHGVAGWERGQWVFLPAIQAPVVSTAGAGDTLLGAVIAWLAAGGSFLPDPAADFHRIDSALAYGNVAAAFKVGRPDTLVSDLTLEALRKFAHAHRMTWTKVPFSKERSWQRNAVGKPSSAQ
jgi:sugar/nucleoside kinase (ribokinase family)